MLRPIIAGPCAALVGYVARRDEIWYEMYCEILYRNIVALVPCRTARRVVADGLYVVQTGELRRGTVTRMQDVIAEVIQGGKSP